jgi:glycosyltransferase involved in cell wall biosynthesis
MRIAIDARELAGHATGVGRCLAGILGAWHRTPEAAAHEFLLYTHAAPAAALDRERFPLRVLNGSGGTLWEQIVLPRAVASDRADVLFSPAYTTPILTRVPRVVTIHDVSFSAHPEWFHWREGARRRALSRQAAHRARAVITVSEFSKREIVKYLSLTEERVHVIPNGVSKPRMTPAAQDAPQSDAALAARRPRRILYVGSIFNRRHVPDMILGFRQLAERHPDVALDLVGDDRSYPAEDIAGLIGALADRRVRWHRYLAEEDLAAVYGSADAFAFLSEYEGFGLTPLEALSAGIPSLLLDTEVAREVCNGAALYVTKGDIAGIANGLATLLFDQSTRSALLAAAPLVLQRHTWTQAAARTLAVLTGAV